jgi:hypothetical protein
MFIYSAQSSLPGSLCIEYLEPMIRQDELAHAVGMRHAPGLQYGQPAAPLAVVLVDEEHDPGIHEG